MKNRDNEKIEIYSNCDHCGEFDCDIDHDEFEFEDDGSWLFDGSGMVGDD